MDRHNFNPPDLEQPQSAGLICGYVSLAQGSFSPGLVSKAHLEECRLGAWPGSAAVTHTV